MYSLSKIIKMGITNVDESLKEEGEESLGSMQEVTFLVHRMGTQSRKSNSTPNTALSKGEVRLPIGEVFYLRELLHCGMTPLQLPSRSRSCII